eukprot:gb/GECG01004278.1/.p1 GENE.gb/GECG01004278.1/~~gb/GECG01004278.1/.p1  ORF type:complete len:582 (+),score=74.76 gb/GECG01004278.1/:1-1746(+)
MISQQQQTREGKVRSPPAQDGVPSVGAPPPLDGTKGYSPPVSTVTEEDKENNPHTLMHSTSDSVGHFPKPAEDERRPLTPRHHQESSLSHLNKLGQLSQTYGYLKSRRSTMKKGAVRSMGAEIKSREKKEQQTNSKQDTNKTPSKCIPHVKPISFSQHGDKTRDMMGEGDKASNSVRGRTLQHNQDLPFALPREITRQFNTRKDDMSGHNGETDAGSFTPSRGFNTRKLHDSRSTAPQRVPRTYRPHTTKKIATLQDKEKVASRIVNAASTPDSFLQRTLKRFREKTSRESPPTKGPPSRVGTASRFSTRSKKLQRSCHKNTVPSASRRKTAAENESVTLKLDFDTNLEDTQDQVNFVAPPSVDLSSIHLESTYQDEQQRPSTPSGDESLRQHSVDEEEPVKTMMSQLSLFSMASSTTNSVFEEVSNSSYNRGTSDPVGRKLEASTESDNSSANLMSVLSFLPSRELSHTNASIPAPCASQRRTASNGYHFSRGEPSPRNPGSSPLAKRSFSERRGRNPSSRVPSSSMRTRSATKTPSKSTDSKKKKKPRSRRSRNLPSRQARTKALQRISSNSSRTSRKK